MPIESLDQMRQHLMEGGSFTVDGGGRLEAQSATRHFFQKIGDAFRALSSSGRAAIDARRAAVGRAMDDIIRRDEMINAGSAELSRTGARSGSARVYAMAEKALVSFFPNLDKEVRSQYARQICERMKGFMSNDQLSAIKPEGMQEIVTAVTKDFVRSKITGWRSINMSAMAEKALTEVAPNLDREVRGRYARQVCERVMGFLNHADLLNTDPEVLREIVSDVAKDVAKEAPKAEAKDAPKAEAKDTPKEAAKDSPKAEAKDAPKEAAKDSRKAEAKDAPKEAAKDSRKAEAKDAPKAAPKNTAKSAPRDMPRGIPGYVEEDLDGLDEMDEMDGAEDAAPSSEKARRGRGLADILNMDAMAEEEVAHLFPDLGVAERARQARLVSDLMKGLLQDADPAGVNLDVVCEIVSAVAKNVASSSAEASEKPSGAGPSTASEPVSGGKAFDAATSVRPENIETEAYEMAERFLKDMFPKLGEKGRFELISNVFPDLMEKGISGMKAEDGSVVRTQLRQAVVEAMERRLAERMPGQLNNALHPAPQVRISAAVELAPENIGADTVLRQSTGMNTCFMHSVLNSMMLTAQGRSLLARHVTSDGRLYVEGRENWDSSSALHAEFSRLENSMAALYAKHDGKWSAGGMGLAAEFAGIFGLTPVLYSVEDGEEKLQGKIAGEKDLEAISRHLNNDRMVLLFKDNHYMAVAGTEAGGLILRNSLTGEEEHWPLDRLAGATVDVRAYPEA